MAYICSTLSTPIIFPKVTITVSLYSYNFIPVMLTLFYHFYYQLLNFIFPRQSYTSAYIRRYSAMDKIGMTEATTICYKILLKSTYNWSLDKILRSLFQECSSYWPDATTCSYTTNNNKMWYKIWYKYIFLAASRSSRSLVVGLSVGWSVGLS